MPEGSPSARRTSSASPSRASRHLHRLPGSGGDVEGARDERALGNLRSGENPLDRAVIENDHPVAAADELVIIGRIEDDGGTCGGEPAQELIHFLLGTDIDAARRIV